MEWTFYDQHWSPAPLPRLLGILNVTPDSFSDGGRFSTIDAAIERGQQLAAEGADIIDIGGESTRPGAEPVSAAEERCRILPVVEQLARRVSTPISVDTMKSEVARAALDAGALIINDISAGLFDPLMLPLWETSRCGVILMHMQGTPRTMQADPQYTDVLAEVTAFLRERVDACAQSGIPPSRIVIDPGIGFGKTAEHNLSLLTHIAGLRAAGRPVLIGHSRKRYLFKLLGRETDERLAGTLGVSIALAMQGADYLRVHDVGAVRDALRSWQAIALGRDEMSAARTEGGAS